MDPHDICTVEPADRGGWTVTLWSVDGDSLALYDVGEARKAFAEAKARAIGEMVATWGTA